MCTTSTVIDGWRDPTWPYTPPWSPSPVAPFIPAPHTDPAVPGPNAIPWPTIVADPKLAQQMLDIMTKLEAIDKRLGLLEQCKVSAREKKNLKARLRRIAAKGKKS